LFLFQRELDATLTRALTYENFDAAKEVRAQREQVDAALAELQQTKGEGCGARRAAGGGQMQFAARGLSLRARLSEAVAGERYAEAAALRDELAALEAAADAAALPCPLAAPRFALGEMVVHSSKGYRGVVAGWDLSCCEGEAWRAAAGVDALRAGPDQVFYHVLVDAADWPARGFAGGDDDAAPVAYVAEELLAAASLADFDSPEPLAGSGFEHPYSYLMFLGSDGHGNMVPSSQLRDKYCVQRKDVYPPGEGPDDDEGDDGGDDGGGGADGLGGGGGGWGGGRSIPGIDMSSLD
jgi:hemimethylated DNA binding protein